MSRPGFALSMLLGTIAVSLLAMRDVSSDAADLPLKRVRSSKVPAFEKGNRVEIRTAHEASYLPYLDLTPFEPTAIQSSATFDVCRTPYATGEFRPPCAEEFENWDFDVESAQTKVAERPEDPAEFSFGSGEPFVSELCVVETSSPLVDPIGMTERWFDELRYSLEDGIQAGWQIWNETESQRSEAMQSADWLMNIISQILPWENVDQLWCDFVAANAEEETLTPVFFETQEKFESIDTTEMAKDFVEDAASTIESVGQALVRFANLIRSKVST